MLWKKTYWFWLGILLLAALSYFTLFWHLGTATIREWDESRNCVNTVDMIDNGNYLVRYYNGNPDFWETKPPLLVWLQIICVKVFGYGEFAFRLPSAAAALATVLVIVRFLYKETKSLLPGVAAAIVLLTNYNYTLHHCARSADHDALLILFELCLVIAFYRYLISDEIAKKNKYLLHCFIFFTLAVYTKSVAVLMLFPGMFIYSFYRKKIVELLKMPRFYIYAGISLLIIGIYYVLHEMQTPGYLQAVWQGELFPRYLNADGVLNEANTWIQYIVEITSKSIIGPVFIGALVFVLIKKEYRKAAVYFLIVAIAFYVVASFGGYNSWYINPIIPLLAVVCGLGVFNVHQVLASKIKGRYLNIALFLLCALFLYKPIEIHLKREVVEATDYRMGKGYGKLLSMIRTEHPEIKEFAIYHPGRHVQPIHFYADLYTKIYKYNVVYCMVERPLKQGERIMCTAPTLKKLEDNYLLQPIATFADCGLYTIDSAH